MTTPPVDTSRAPFERVQYIRNVLSCLVMDQSPFTLAVLEAISDEFDRVIEQLEQLESEEIAPPRNDPLDPSPHQFDDGEHLVEEQIDR